MGARSFVRAIATLPTLKRFLIKKYFCSILPHCCVNLLQCDVMSSIAGGKTGATSEVEVTVTVEEGVAAGMAEGEGYEARQPPGVGWRGVGWSQNDGKRVKQQRRVCLSYLFAFRLCRPEPHHS